VNCTFYLTEPTLFCPHNLLAISVSPMSRPNRVLSSDLEIADTFMASALMKIRSKPPAVEDVTTNVLSKQPGRQEDRWFDAARTPFIGLVPSDEGLASGFVGNPLRTARPIEFPVQGTQGCPAKFIQTSEIRFPKVTHGFGKIQLTSKCFPSAPLLIAPAPLVIAPAPPVAGVMFQEHVEAALNDAGETKQVRSEQIEAALLSDSQRGRKRSNLNQFERLELTRTRNREHAKSTRTRKKARYLELERKEAAFQNMQEEKKLESDRRRSIKNFLTLRELQYTQCAAVRGAERVISSKTNAIISGILADADNFTFEYDQTSDNVKGLDRMRLFDESIFRRISTRFGASTSNVVSYLLSSDGIAISQNDTAFLEIDLHLPCHEKSAKLISAIVKVKFTLRSHKICSATWHATLDAIDDVTLDPICCQTSHPSVVSLDPVLGSEGGAICPSSSANPPV
jgi:hypothetical protein